MDPIFLSIGPLDLRWYGVLIATGVVLGAVWTVRAARARGLDPEWLLDLAPGWCSRASSGRGSCTS